MGTTRSLCRDYRRQILSLVPPLPLLLQTPVFQGFASGLPRAQVTPSEPVVTLLVTRKDCLTELFRRSSAP